MKISFRAFVTAAVATGLIALRVIAQDAPASPAPQTNITPVAQPAAAETNATAKKAEPKKTPKAAVAKPAAKKLETMPVPAVLHPEPGVTRQNNVNVRGQASINS